VQEQEVDMGSRLRDGHARVEVDSASALWAWLEGNHDRDDGVWLVTWKKAAGARYVSREEVLDALVAFGWTDGARRAREDDRTEQLISPRRAVHWARSYRDRAERLIAEGRMQPPGLASVEAARRAGTWDDHDDVDQLAVPDDLADALAARAGARATYDGWPPSHRRNVLRWIRSARTAPTRADRIDRTAGHAERGERVPQR
jgi:uncharacterized protein YdeI (YjbR/CyaY-like superfamily)